MHAAPKLRNSWTPQLGQSNLAVRCWLRLQLHATTFAAPGSMIQSRILSFVTGTSATPASENSVARDSVPLTSFGGFQPSEPRPSKRPSAGRPAKVLPPWPSWLETPQRTGNDDPKKNGYFCKLCNLHHWHSDKGVWTKTGQKSKDEKALRIVSIVLNCYSYSAFYFNFYFSGLCKA